MNSDAFHDPKGRQSLTHTGNVNVHDDESAL